MTVTTTQAQRWRRTILSLAEQSGGAPLWSGCAHTARMVAAMVAAGELTGDNDAGYFLTAAGALAAVREGMA